MTFNRGNEIDDCLVVSRLVINDSLEFNAHFVAHSLRPSNHQVGNFAVRTHHTQGIEGFGFERGNCLLPIPRRHRPRLSTRKGRTCRKLKGNARFPNDIIVINEIISARGNVHLGIDFRRTEKRLNVKIRRRISISGNDNLQVVTARSRILGIRKFIRCLRRRSIETEKNEFRSVLENFANRLQSFIGIVVSEKLTRVIQKIFTGNRNCLSNFAPIHTKRERRNATVGKRSRSTRRRNEIDVCPRELLILGNKNTTTQSHFISPL